VLAGTKTNLLERSEEIAHRESAAALPPVAAAMLGLMPMLTDVGTLVPGCEAGRGLPASRDVDNHLGLGLVDVVSNFRQGPSGPACRAEPGACLQEVERG